MAAHDQLPHHMIPVDVEVPARTYGFFGYPLAIVAASRGITDILAAGYIHLAFDEEPDSPVPFSFYFYNHRDLPGLETIKLTQSWVAGTGADLYSFIEDQIRQGFCVDTTIDEFYVPHRAPHGVRHYLHDVLIHGVTHDEAAILGYDDRGTFRTHRVPKDAVRNGLVAAMADEQDFEIVLYRPDNTDFRMTPRLVCEELRAFLASANPSERHAAVRTPWERIYGIASWDAGAAALLAAADGRCSHDVRTPHLLWEHSRIMGIRARALSSAIGHQDAAVQKALAETSAYLRDLTYAVLVASVAPEQSTVKATLRRFAQVRGAYSEAVTTLSQWA